jgi:hypothetical protein
MKGEYKAGMIGGFNRKGHAPEIGKKVFADGKRKGLLVLKQVN